MRRGDAEHQAQRRSRGGGVALLKDVSGFGDDGPYQTDLLLKETRSFVQASTLYVKCGPSRALEPLATFTCELGKSFQ